MAEWNQRQLDFIKERTRVAKAQILHSLITGEPYADKPFTLAKIHDFGDLHDLCDANTLGGWCDDEGRTAAWRDALFPRRPVDETEGALWLDAAQESHAQVDGWIRSGTMGQDMIFVARMLDREETDCLLDEDRWLEAFGMLEDRHSRVRGKFTDEAVRRLRSLTPREMPLWLTEHGELANDEREVQGIVDGIPPQWADTSWHNDTTASWQLDIDKEHYYRFWLEMAEPERREMPEMARFVIVRCHVEHTDDVATLYKGESWDEARAHLQRLADDVARDFAAPVEALRELRRHIVYDSEGELSRDAFDAMLARADAILKVQPLPAPPTPAPTEPPLSFPPIEPPSNGTFDVDFPF